MPMTPQAPITTNQRIITGPKTRLGPLPNLYENSWHQPGKIASAIAEAVAALISLVGLVVAARTRRRRRG
jgi:hypothetical protein